uniref:recombinase family protein n=1 Tax=Pseudomonas sp. EL_65y_Pfl1_R83 TaxID=3088697 RepID=UPI0030DDC3A1
MRVGYARVSTSDQNPDLQLDALRRAGCERVFTEKASGARDDRPELARILGEVLRAGDTLVVWKLDRLARSLKKLIASAEELGGRRWGWFRRWGGGGGWEGCWWGWGADDFKKMGGGGGGGGGGG